VFISVALTAKFQETYDDNGTFENPAQELFIWCIFMRMQEMAMIFLQQGKVGSVFLFVNVLNHPSIITFYVLVF
jgi:hypothetical protein